MDRNSAEAALREREKYILSFNSTMVRIWKEKIALLGVVDTGALYRSVVALGMRADGKFISVTLSQSFNLYGIYVNYGVGKETWRGNPGDIAIRRDGSYNPRLTVKRRIAKPWFSNKYYASVMNLQEFYSDNLGRQGMYVIAEALNKDSAKYK